MLKKITVNSKKELAEILLSGRTLQTESGSKVYFDDSQEYTPFAVTYPDGCRGEMMGSWELKEFYEEVPWEEELKKRPILCWVSDECATKRYYSALVKSWEDGCYFAICGTTWKYATPVERDAEELL